MSRPIRTLRRAAKCGSISSACRSGGEELQPRRIGTPRHRQILCVPRAVTLRDSDFWGTGDDPEAVRVQRSAIRTGVDYEVGRGRLR